MEEYLKGCCRSILKKKKEKTIKNTLVDFQVRNKNKDNKHESLTSHLIIL